MKKNFFGRPQEFSESPRKVDTRALLRWIAIGLLVLFLGGFAVAGLGGVAEAGDGEPAQEQDEEPDRDPSQERPGVDLPGRLLSLIHI